MATFNFITDEGFRASLESDYLELKNAVSTGSWKSVHVLAGSIIEAILIDYLLATNKKQVPEADILKMDLGTAIAECRNDKVLSDRTEKLADVIRDYRNLIHPGRIVRLKETVDENGAVVAQALVEMIVKEVTERRKEAYGYTAEQLVAKLESDPSVGPAIVEQMLKSMHSKEIERLLLYVLPERHMAIESEDFQAEDVRDLSALEMGFDRAFGIAPDALKLKVVSKYVSLLKEGSEYQIQSYERAFFTGSDLRYCSADDAQLIKEHIFLVANKGTHSYSTILLMLSGMGEFLNEDELNTYVNVLMKIIEHRPDRSKVLELIRDEWTRMDQDAVVRMGKRLEAWIPIFRTRREYALAKELGNFLSVEVDDVPEELDIGDIPF